MHVAASLSACRAHARRPKIARTCADDAAAPDQLAVHAQHAARTVLTVRRDQPLACRVRRHAQRQRAGAGDFRTRSTGLPAPRSCRSRRASPASTKRCSNVCRHSPEVRVAAPVIEAVVGTRLPGQGNLLVLGVDMTGDRSLRDYDLAAGDEAILDDPLVFLAQPDSIMVSDRLPAQRARAQQRACPLETVDGPKDFISPRHPASERPDQCVRRQPRDHGRLRGAVRVRPRPQVRSHRPRGDAGYALRRRPGRAESLLGPPSRSQPPSTPGQSFRIAAARLPLHAVLLECFRGCSWACSSSTTRSRLPSRSGAARSACCARSARRAARSGRCSSRKPVLSALIGIGGWASCSGSCRRRRWRRGAARLVQGSLRRGRYRT